MLTGSGACQGRVRVNQVLSKCHVVVQKQQNFYYKIAIPAAASVHEFHSLLGQDPKGVMQDSLTATGEFKNTFSFIKKIFMV